MSNVPPGQDPPGGWPPPTGGYEPPSAPPPPPGYQQPPGPEWPQQQQPVGPGGRPLAEWWKRLVAVLLDGIILGLPLGILRATVTVNEEEVKIDPLTGEVTEGEGFLAGVGLVLFLLSIAVPILYQGLLNGSDRGQTIGKMALRIQVRDADGGGPIGMGRGVLRAVVYQLLFLACFVPGFINGLSPLWDKRRQGWHDKAVRSVVVDAP